MATLPILSIEGGREAEFGYVTFTVRLSEPATDAVTVDYRMLEGTVAVGDVRATQVGDPLSGTLTFAPGELVQTIRLYAFHDNVDELDESFFVELSNPTRASFGGANQSLQAVGWVLDDDGPGLDRSLAISNPTVVEKAGGQAVFTISLSEPFATATTFSYSTYNGSALAGSDYVAKSGTVTFAAGQTEATVAVDLLNNNLIEAGESFGLRVSGAAGVAGAVGEARILNDDGPRPILSIEGGREAEFGYVTFTVRLSEPATDAVTVDYRMLEGTVAVGDVRATQVGDPLSGTLTFAPGELVQTIRLYAFHDNVDELDESFFVELSNPTRASFGGANQSLQAVGWVLDDDGPGLDRSLAISNPTVVERPGAVAVFQVELSEASSTPLTVGYRTVGQSASAGRDFVATTGQITFAAGQTLAEVRVNLKPNAFAEAAESFQLQLIPPFPSQISGSAIVQPGRATILDYVIRGTNGNDVRTGTSSPDRIEGLGGHDRLSGEGGNDRIYGGDGRDTVFGGSGDDLLQGGAGWDQLYAGQGRDVLMGGRGKDTLHGGTDRWGEDFVFSSRFDSAVGTGHDVVRNFTRGSDDIDLRGIDARAQTPGFNNAFAWSGRTAADHSVWWSTSSNGVLLKGDVNGDARADFEILLVNLAALGAGDVLL